MRGWLSAPLPGGKYRWVPEAELDAVDVEGARQLLNRREDEVADLGVGEVEWGAQLVVGARRGLLYLEVGVVDEETGAPAPHALFDRDVAVVVVDADPGQELHAAPAALVQKDLKRLHAGVEQRQEAPVLEPGVVVEAGRSASRSSSPGCMPPG